MSFIFRENTPLTPTKKTEKRIVVFTLYGPHRLSHMDKEIQESILIRKLEHHQENSWGGPYSQSRISSTESNFGSQFSVVEFPANHQMDHHSSFDEGDSHISETVNKKSLS